MPTLVDNDFFVDFDPVTAGVDSEGNGLTTEQQDFFKQSKCVDEYGNLYLVYRATNHDYDTNCFMFSNVIHILLLFCNVSTVTPFMV